MTTPARSCIQLANIYVKRGLDAALAKQVAEQLTAHDALAAHARDELGLTEEQAPRPLQAAFSSAASFTAGAAAPLAVVAIFPGPRLPLVVSAATLVLLATLGGLAARAGGAHVATGAWRVTFWGALALGITAGVGALVGTAV